MGEKRNRQAHLSKTANAMQSGQARALDDLAEYAEFQQMFLPAIRKALLDGKNSDQIMAHFKPLVSARLVQLGLTGSESASLGAIKELFDRVEGKATQKMEHTHKLAKIKDNELDAILASKLQKLEAIETSGGVVDDEQDESDK